MVQTQTWGEYATTRWAEEYPHFNWGSRQSASHEEDPTKEVEGCPLDTLLDASSWYAQEGKESNAAEKVKEKKEDAAMKKEELRLVFTICKESCHCSSSPKCIISGFKQCSVCLDVLKSWWSKTLCVVDGKKQLWL